MAGTKATIGTTSTDVVAKNHQRRILVLANDADETIYLKPGAAAVLNEGLRLKVADSIALFRGDPFLTDPWYGICTSGSKNLCILEG